MLGAYLVFGLVVAIVAAYMTIVHKFLVDAEEPEDGVREAKLHRETPAQRSRGTSTRRNRALDPKAA